MKKETATVLRVAVSIAVCGMAFGWPSEGACRNHEFWTNAAIELPDGRHWLMSCDRLLSTAYGDLKLSLRRVRRYVLQINTVLFFAL